MHHLLTSLAGASLIGLLTDCTNRLPEETSYVRNTNFRDISAITVFIADVLANSMDAGKSTLRLVPCSGPDKAHAQTLLTDTLRERGFALSPEGMTYPDAHNVRYSVSPLDSQLLLELNVDDASATCFYTHDTDGALRRAGNCTLHAGTALTLHIPVRDVPVSGEGNSPDKPLSPVLPDEVPVSGTWVLVEDRPVEEQLVAWGDRGGWRVLWPEKLDWTVPVMTRFSGDFKSAVSSVLQAAAHQGIALKAEFHVSNHVLIIAKKG